MKKYFILSVLCFLWSCYLQGQFFTRTCLSSDVKVNIEEVIWDATPSVLDSLEGTVTSGINVPASFHIVRLGFDLPLYFIQNGSLHIANIAVFQSNKPVVALLEPYYEGFVVEGIWDVEGNLSGFTLSRIGTGVGGVATTAGVMARNGISPACVEIAVTNRMSFLENGTTCNLLDNNVIGCKSKLPFKLASNEVTNIYPNPAKNRLLVDFNDLKFNEINIMNMRGEILNHKTRIRYGVNRAEVDTSQLLPGIYLLEMKSSTGNSIEKIIIH